MENCERCCCCSLGLWHAVYDRHNSAIDDGHRASIKEAILQDHNQFVHIIQLMSYTVYALLLFPRYGGRHP